MLYYTVYMLHFSVFISIYTTVLVLELSDLLRAFSRHVIISHRNRFTICIMPLVYAVSILTTFLTASINGRGANPI